MNAPRKKLAIIDGKSVFYRGYYALPNLSTKEGVPTGGVYGFAAMSLELIKKLKPDYVAVAWDKPKTNIRSRLKMYPQYKAGRKAPPPDFYTQIPILHELLEAFGWPLYELDDYEADDIMATLAVQAREKDIETQLITSDLDALQLINGHVRVYALKKGFSNIEEFHTESFEDKYGLKAQQFLDLKSLKGDSSDNIPGVPGIGEKTAIELLKQYKTLDGVYENIDLIKDSLRNKLLDGKDMAYLSKQLAKLWTDAPLKLDLEAMDVTKLDTEHLRGLLQALEFRSLLDKLPEHMRTQGIGDRGKGIAGGAKLDLPEMILINADKDLTKIKLPEAGKIFIHSRAAGKHGANPQALIIGTDKVAYTLDLTKLDHKKVAQTLTSNLSPLTSLIGYDLKGDIKLLKTLGLDIRNVEHDILIAAFLLNPLMRVQTLTDLATISFGYEGVSLEDLPTEDFIERSAEIMAVIQKLHHVQIHEFGEAPTLEKLAKKVEWPLIPILADMEQTGIKLDVKYLKNFSKKIDDSISDLEQSIYGHADQEFNISSPSQLADILFTKLNLPKTGIKRGKTGYSTAASELDKLRGLHPIIDLISQYREATKLKNTYVDTLPEQVDENDRIHTTFNLTIAQTGRLSSADPNLQNIPIRTELGKNIRTAFVADQGCVFVSADYSQFELRLAASFSGDQDMIDAFNNDKDIHAETAALVLDIPLDKVTKEQRYAAKAVNFGILYGQGPHGLSVGTGMDYGAARAFIAKYFEVRPKLKNYIDSVRKEAEEQGFVETILGRRRPTPDVKSSNFAVREAAYRAAVNMPLQGSAADLMKLAMVEIHKNLNQSSVISHQSSVKPQMLLQIHDSILLECSEKDAKAVGKIVKETMESVYELPVKLKADISTGKNWGEL